MTNIWPMNASTGVADLPIMIRAQEIELDLASERGRCAMADEIAEVVSANGASALRGQNPLLNVSVGSIAPL